MRGPYKKRAHRLEQEVAAAKKDRDAVEVIEVESSTEKVAPAGEEHGQEVQSGRILNYYTLQQPFHNRSQLSQPGDFAHLFGAEVV
ncbi:hypothetical protein BHM03_00053013 [Ensete ventricosum]|nr:hypothetical protein BHM03_00053013 [Ensete ventricosum]